MGVQTKKVEFKHTGKKRKFTSHAIGLRRLLKKDYEDVKLSKESILFFESLIHRSTASLSRLALYCARAAGRETVRRSDVRLALLLSVPKPIYDKLTQ